ncbi:MAG: hypothetical protein HC772_10590 [Leptolyngbyaceae cyanobacterium CRU_2_3]|nr:hypothetical protein [Leptolyngbyaceae cyanobacterium CRU_2_3]
MFQVLATVRERNRLQLNRAAIYNVAITPQGEELATTEDDDTIRLWNTSAEQIDQFPTGQGIVRSIAFSADGKQLATGGEDGSILIWTIRDRKIDLTQNQLRSSKLTKEKRPKGQF